MGEKAVILFDRGLLDSKAYVTDAEFKKYISISNKNEDVLRNSYDAVFHLKSVACTDENTYIKNCNSVRKEDVKPPRNLTKNYFLYGQAHHTCELYQITVILIKGSIICLRSIRVHRCSGTS